jgi:ketosteroid isomerase-like protein
MRRIYGLAAAVLLVVASFSLALGQSNGEKKSQSEDVARTVSVLDHIWLDAAHNRDTGTMAWLFSSDFVEVHPDGEIVTGQQQMDQVKAPDHELVELHPDNIQVRYTSSDVAVLTDTTTIRDKSGTKFNGRYRVIRVFVKQGGRWRAAGAGISPIASE